MIRTRAKARIMTACKSTFPSGTTCNDAAFSTTFYRQANVDRSGYRYVLVDFREDGVTPYLTIWKHGLVETKV